MGKKILLVDDEADTRLVFAESLRYHGFDVTAVGDGMTAMDSLEKQKPDLILLDMLMPGLSGWEMVQMIKADARFRDIPVIAVSAAAGVADEPRALRLGCSDFLAKPCEGKDLAERINRVLSRKRAL